MILWGFFGMGKMILVCLFVGWYGVVFEVLFVVSVGV